MRRFFWLWAGLLGMMLMLHQPAQVALAACIRTGTILVVNASDDSEVGSLGNTFNAFGQYGITTVEAEPLAVRFSDGPRFSLLTMNSSDPTVPFLGGIVGFASTSDDLGAGSANYIYLGGTVETPVDAAPSGGDNSFAYATNIMKSIESAIWSIDADNVITAHWVNSDLSKPATSIIYNEAENALLLVGDPQAFVEEYGTAPTVRFRFVQSGSSGSTCSQTTTPTRTPTPPVGTITATRTPTSGGTITATRTIPVGTITATRTPTIGPSVTSTRTPTNGPSVTSTRTPPVGTITATKTPTGTIPVGTITATKTATTGPSITATRTQTAGPTMSSTIQPESFRTYLPLLRK